jgi:hypothetical protein
MRRIRIVGLCLVAAFAFSALVASAAQAAGPEWGRCVAQKKGEYTEGNCQTKSAKAHKGKFEWKPGAPTGCEPQKKGEYTNETCTSKSAKKHKGHFEKTAGPRFTSAGGHGVLTTDYDACQETDIEPVCQEVIVDKLNAYVECASETGSGEESGLNGLKNIQVTFKSCYFAGSIECNTTGANEGEIKTTQLEGELGYIEKATHKVGVVLHPASGNLFAQFECAQYSEGEPHVVEGGAYVSVGEGNATQGKFFEPGGEHVFGGGPDQVGGGDGIISPITPVNEMSTKFTQVYSTDGNFEEPETVPSKFEGGPFEELESQDEELTNRGHGTQWAAAGESITNVNTPEGSGEIKG